MFEITPEILSRFWNKVKKSNNCWKWTTYTRSGYGRFKINGKLVTAHRFSYELIHVNIPTGYELDHLCRNRKCVNPEHLKIVTRKVNVLRGIGPTAINKNKTHCINGHLLTGKNLALRENNNRQCKTCRKNWKPTPKAYNLQKQHQKLRKYKDRQNFLLRKKKLTEIFA